MKKENMATKIMTMLMILTLTIPVSSANMTTDDPIANPGGPYSGNEGQAIIFDASGSTAARDRQIVSYAWDFGDGTPVVTNDPLLAGWKVEHTYGDNGQYIATLTVTDNNAHAKTDTKSITVNVANVPPTGNVQTSVTGDTVNMVIQFLDVFADINAGISVDIKWGDSSSSQEIAGTDGILSVSHTYADAGTYQIDLTATDKDGGVWQYTTTVNIAPCKCESVSIKPVAKITEGKNGKKTTVDDPSASGERNVADPKTFDLTIDASWHGDLKCTEGTGNCKATYVPTVTSTWETDEMDATVVESHKGVGSLECSGPCDKTTPFDMKTQYKAKITKGKGKEKGKHGDITKKVKGTITLLMDNPDCNKDHWKMVLVYEAELKNGDIISQGIDYYNSDFDGDGFSNGVEDKKGTDRLDPNSHPK